MNGDISQGKMAAANTDGAAPSVATQPFTPATNSSLQLTTSPPATFHPDSLVTLLVGPEEDKMVVHRTFLSQDSAFFKAALKKQWAEGQTRVIKLPEESLELMQDYIGHLYGVKLPTRVLVTGSCEVNDGHYEALGRLYVLGERMLDTKYQNKIICEFFRLTQVCNYYPVGSCINVIYEGTTPESPARRMLLDFATEHGSESWFDTALHTAPGQEYLLDLSKALFQEMAARESANDFRRLPMKAEDYFVSENT